MNTVVILILGAVAIYLAEKGILTSSPTQTLTNIGNAAAAALSGGASAQSLQQATNLPATQAAIVQQSPAFSLTGITPGGTSTGQDISLGGVIGASAASIGAAIPAGSAALASALGAIGIGAQVVPVIGTIIGAVAVLASQIFKGANPNQVPAAQIEQVYEATAFNMTAVMKYGMITKDIEIQIINALIQGSQTAELQARLGTPSIKGAINAAYVLNAEIAKVQATPTVPALQPIDLNIAHSLYIPQNTKGWYPNSLSEAWILSDKILQELAQ